MILRISLSF